jgi:hypothetical protein
VQDRVGSLEHAVEVIPGWLWMGSEQAATQAVLTELGITHAINATAELRNDIVGAERRRASPGELSTSMQGTMGTTQGLTGRLNSKDARWAGRGRLAVGPQAQDGAAGRSSGGGASLKASTSSSSLTRAPSRSVIRQPTTRSLGNSTKSLLATPQEEPGSASASRSPASFRAGGARDVMVETRTERSRDAPPRKVSVWQVPLPEETEPDESVDYLALFDTAFGVLERIRAASKGYLLFTEERPAELPASRATTASRSAPSVNPSEIRVPPIWSEPEASAPSTPSRSSGQLVKNNPALRCCVHV